MKATLLIFAVVMVGCVSTPVIDYGSNNATAKAEIEKWIRKSANKSTGELSKADLEKVTEVHLAGSSQYQITDVSPFVGLRQLKVLVLNHNKLTDVSALAGLKQLTHLHLFGAGIQDVSPLMGLSKLKILDLRHNPDLTKAQIAELQKALPKCNISHDAKK